MTRKARYVTLPRDLYAREQWCERPECGRVFSTWDGYRRHITANGCRNPARMIWARGKRAGRRVFRLVDRGGVRVWVKWEAEPPPWAR